MGLLQGALSIRGFIPAGGGAGLRARSTKKDNPASGLERMVNPACSQAGRFEPVSACLILKY